MKAGQNSIVRWVARIIAKGAHAPARQPEQIRTLDDVQLRQVSGGAGSTTQSPNKGW
jgi:hypothetical protein